MGKVVLIPSMYGVYGSVSLHDINTPRNTGIKIIIDLHGAPGSQVRHFSGSVVVAENLLCIAERV